MEGHLDALTKLCRLCGNFQTKNTYLVNKYAARILETLFIDVTTDVGGIQPAHICHKCYTKMSHIIERKSTIPLEEIPTWTEHRAVCGPCNQVKLKRPGGHRKKKKSPGRPKADTKSWTWKIVDNILPKSTLPALIPHDIPQERIVNSEELLQLCKCTVMSTRCQHLFCYNCVVPHVLGKNETDAACPVCDVAFTFECLIVPSHIVNLIKLLTVNCCTCRKGFTIYNYGELCEHEMNCQIPAPPPTEYLLKDVFSLDENSEIPRLAEDAALHIIKAKLKKEQSTTCRFPSGGSRPTVISLSTAAFKGSENVSKKTLRRRTIQMQNSLQSVAGPSRDSMILQTGLLVKSFDSSERKKILEMAKIKRVQIDAKSLVAMKADLSMPWDKMKAMSRRFKMFNISMASNTKQRVVAKQWHGDSFTVEEAPFTFPVKDKRNEYQICSTPLASIAHFPSHVINLLDLLEENQLLIFQSDSQAVHVKIGGDHGGNSFKMCFQIVNMKSPNSKENTMVFSMFEAKDYRCNLKIALNMYHEQINELQLMTWKNREIKVFMFGDYQFLCNVSGITGANGRHSCLWCLSTKDEIQIKDVNGMTRTVETMRSDLESYFNDGSILKKAKLYHNVIYTAMFNIPLDQV